MTLDISGDFALWDGQETVSLTRREADGTTTTYSGIAGLRRAVRGAYQAPGAKITLDLATWHLDAGDLTITPDRGDVITDASGDDWLILNSNLESLANRYRCETQKDLS